MHYYSLLELKESCEEVLCKETNIDTVLNMLVLADRHQAGKLKDVCVKFLIENCHTVVRQPGWRELLQPYPALLAGIITIHVDCRAAENNSSFRRNV